MLSNIDTGKQFDKATALLKGDDVARILNISRSFAFQLMQRGEIPIVKLGRAVRVRPADLEQFITESLTPK